MDKKRGFVWYPHDWWSSDAFIDMEYHLRYPYLEICFKLYVEGGKWKVTRKRLKRLWDVELSEEDFRDLGEFFEIDGEGYWSNGGVSKRMSSKHNARVAGVIGNLIRYGHLSKEEAKRMSDDEVLVVAGEAFGSGSRSGEGSGRGSGVGSLKEKKEKKSKGIEERANDFKKMVYEWADKKEEYAVYANVKNEDRERLSDFIGYWSEYGEGDKKMRFEKEKSFGIGRRVGTWMRNARKWGEDNKEVEGGIDLDLND